MDFFNHSYLSTRTSYDYTFNFWNDYLGLSTLVTQSSKRGPGGESPNSITESLKATLGLDDSAHLDYCCCSSSCCSSSSSCGCCPPASPPPPSLVELKERFSSLGPFRSPGAGFAGHDPGFPGGLGGGGSFSAFDLFGADRKLRKATARTKQEPKICVFCRNNGAPEEVYGSHVLKAPDGRVVCPILRAYTCPLCSANGDNAHTIKYCPLSKEQPASRTLKGGRAVGGKRVKIL